MKGLVLIAVLLTTAFVIVGCTDEAAELPVSAEIAVPAETNVPLVPAATTVLAETKALAEAGNAEAQFNLGSLYAEGKTAPNDFVEAKKWFSKAGEQGHAQAMYFLGIIYIRGFGIEPDINQGYTWLCLAAKAGFESATEDCNHFADELSPEALIVANKRIDELFEEIQLQ